MPYLVIYNEQAGKAFAKQHHAIKAFFDNRNLPVVIHSITKDGSFQNLNPHDYERIICAGGDGTVKEVANWIIKSKSTTPLAILPKGTGNIIAASLQIPHNITQALELAVHGNVQSIDAGLINDREYFLLAAGIGLDASIIRQTTRPLKKIFGFLAYVLITIQNFFRLKSNKVFIKSKEFEGSVQAQAIIATKIDSFLNLKFHPDARMNDGMMVVSVFKPISILDIITIFRKILKGVYETDWRFQSFKTDEVYILPYNKHTPRQIDGEESSLPYFDIKVVSRALNMVTNKQL